MPGHLVNVENLRVVASIASCNILIKMFDWLRLLEATAFYIMLLEHTMKDVVPFMVLIGVALCMFGIPLVIINQNRAEANSAI